MLSLLVRLIAGDGAILILAQVATALILVLAANTSFADFPRLSSFLARDGFLPRQFAFRGERLAFTTGIIALAGMAIALLIIFQASVSGLIPLYTLGVFIAFTLSQSGMFIRWYRRREAGWLRGLLINGLGAATTGVVMVVVGVSNFFNGSWLVIVLVPILMVFLSGIRRHYRNLDDRLALERIPPGKEVAAEPIVIVPVARLDRTARQAIAFANSISKTATAVHITNNPESAAELRERWPDWAGATELVVVESPYRALVGPLLALHGRPAGPGSRPPGAGRPVRGGAAPLVGEPAAQPDRPAPEAPTLQPPEHHRGRRPLPPAHRRVVAPTAGWRNRPRISPRRGAPDRTGPRSPVRPPREDPCAPAFRLCFSRPSLP